MVHRPSEWSTVLCLDTLKADCPSSCLIPSVFLNLWLLVPLTAKQPIGWNIKAPPHFLWKQDDITTPKPSALSHPPHRVTVVFQSWIHQIPEEQNQWPLHCQPEFLLQMIRSQALTVCFHPALLKAISPKCILTWAMSLYSCTISHEKICPFHRTHGLNRPACVKIFPFISMPNDGTGLELRSRLP